MLAVDVSNYTGPLSADQIAAWQADGVQLVIVQAVDPPAGYPPGCTREQIQACQAAGMAVEAYVYLWFSLGTPDIQAKLSLLDGLGIERVWLDVEDTSAHIMTVAKHANVVQTMTATIQSALTAIQNAGYTTGIYTGRWFWTGYMGNTTAFSSLDLWDSHYDGDPNPSDDFVPYGGWTRCLYKQYAGTSTLDGVGNVDLDVEG